MKINEDLHKNVLDEIQSKSLLNAEEFSITAIINKHINNTIYFTCLIGIGLILNSCIGGFIITEPNYVENTRPSCPSNLHIWIEGDWFWSSQTRTYIQRNGHWEQPRPNRTYVEGYWETSSRGKYWKSGHWKNQGQKGNKHKR